MKKNFLFKGASALGAALLLVTSVAPGLQYAFAESTSTEAAWDYVHDEESWQTAYDKPDSALKAYEDYYRYEDLWSDTEGRRALLDDIRCEFTSYADKDGETLYATGVIKGVKYAPWFSTDYNEVEVVQNSVPGFDGTHFYLEKNAINLDLIKNGSDTLYELYINSDLKTSAGIWVKIDSCSYPGFTKSGKAWNATAWAVVKLPIPFKGTISISYDGAAPVYPWGESVRTFNYGFGIASIPDDNIYTPYNENFDPAKVTVTLLAPVACIMAGSEPADNDVCYGSVRSAVKNALDGATIYLVADDHVSLDADNLELGINKAITIDGKKSDTENWTLYGVNDYVFNGNDHDIYISGEGNITIQNLNISEFAGNHYANRRTYPIWVGQSYAGTLTLKNVNFDKFNRTAINANGGTVIVDGCTITGDPTTANDDGHYFLGGIEAYKADVTVKDTTITGIGAAEINDEKSRVAACIQISGNADTAALGTATIKLKGSNNVCEGQYSLMASEYAGVGKIIVEGGTYNGDFLNDDTADTEGEHFLILGGKFSVDPTGYLGDGLSAPLKDGMYVVGLATAQSRLVHDQDAFPEAERENNGTSNKAKYELSGDGKTLTVTGKIDWDGVHKSEGSYWNRYGIAVLISPALKSTFPSAKILLNDKEYNLWDIIDGSLSSDPSTKNWPDGVYWYPPVKKSNQTDTIEIRWDGTDGAVERYTINVVDAILVLPDDGEINSNSEVPSGITSQLVLPAVTDDDDAVAAFTVTVGEMIYEGIPGSVTFTEPGISTVSGSDVATNSNFTAQVLKIFQMNFASHATFSKPLGIKLKTDKNAKIKVKHTGEAGYGFNGLTTGANASCTNGIASSPYDGTELPVDENGFVTIYTCGASEFVAYTETQSSGGGSSSGGGGSSSGGGGSSSGGGGSSSGGGGSSSGGGGGGGSSSYSCKNLPANAVANNTTKPKKNTNYSYSTDTGAVCTFQCKTGYTWNEKDSKCEKTDKTVKNTDKTVKNTEATVADSTTYANTTYTTAAGLRKVLDDGFTVEFHKAYDFAFKNGITTMNYISNADMNGPLTRIAMAKMLSQYVINIIGKIPDTGKTISFPDVDEKLNSEYNNGVTLAYQLGIMGIGIDEFRPFDYVTRAEFATALSRILYGLDDGEPYYATHLQKLKQEGIITNDNPNIDEKRGYVMIMLMRSVSN